MRDSTVPHLQPSEKDQGAVFNPLDLHWSPSGSRMAPMVATNQKRSQPHTTNSLQALKPQPWLQPSSSLLLSSLDASDTKVYEP